MQWRAFEVISRVDVQPSFDEVTHGDRLVALGSYMQHVYSVQVASVDVTSVPRQKSDERYVSVKRSEMNSRKSILTFAGQIDPVC